MEDKRLASAERLLDRGVRFRLPAPFWLRWLRPSITLRAYKAGTILAFSEVVLKHNLEDLILKESSMEQLNKSIKPIAECVAISALNSYVGIKLLKKMLSRYLLWQVDKKTLLEMFKISYELSSTKDFTIITKLYIQTMQSMMNPNLGQMESGS